MNEHNSFSLSILQDSECAEAELGIAQTTMGSLLENAVQQSGGPAANFSTYELAFPHVFKCLHLLGYCVAK